MGRQGASAEVISIAARPGYRRSASMRVANAREQAGMTVAEYAAHLTSLLGWRVTPEAVEHWEGGATAPGDVIEACIGGAGLAPALLAAVPHAFPADALAGPWVTAYQFTHAGRVMAHADIAVVTAESDRHVLVVNHPPWPRTEGRAVPFLNEIAAELAGRHLIGLWRNTSDARYFGSLHLAVLPGETVMEGIYTGLASDVAVSSGPWRWVRLDPASLPEDLSRVTLQDPAAVREAVAGHGENNGPLRLADIGEEH